MRLWQEGNAGEALRHLMTATTDPEVAFYAARQVATMGDYALPVLYKGLWHREEVVQRQSAVILGWIGSKESVEPLLRRMKFPDAPLEVEYALRKIGSLTADQLLSIRQSSDLSNAKLLDRKVATIGRLANGLRLAVDPVPLFQLVETIEAVKATELEEQPFGHMANARLNLLLFLAERGVSKTADHLVDALQPGAREANLAIAEALIRLGGQSSQVLEAAFKETKDDSVRVLIAVTHYFLSGASDLASSGPLSLLLNEVQGDLGLAKQTAHYAAWFSSEPNPLLSWFRYHPAPEVRKALATELPGDKVRARRSVKSFFLEKTEDDDLAVAAAHIDYVGKYLPDDEVETRLERLLGAQQELAVLRKAALETAGRNGSPRLLLTALRQMGDPLRKQAVELVGNRTEPELMNAVLAMLREPEPSDAKRAAIQIAAVRWRRPEAEAPLLELVRLGDPLWRDASRGLAALESKAAVEYFVALVDAGREIDREEAGAIYFAFTGIPSRLSGERAGTFQFVPLDLERRPSRDQVLVILRERSDFRGWVKIEERWEGERLFRIDEAGRELVLYDRGAYDRLEAGAGVVLLETTTRQTVLSPLELSEQREQQITVIEELPHFPFAGVRGRELRLINQGHWTTVAFGQDLRDDVRGDMWGRSALIPLGYFDRDKIHFVRKAPPSGWLRDESQPLEPERRP
jgi:HEAT repeat protein